MLDSALRHTGTAAIRVGWSILVSPLLPFLIFVDLGWEKETSIDNLNYYICN